MSSTVVLDASALLAFLQGEPGEEAVAQALQSQRCLVTAANQAEVISRALDRGGEPAVIEQLLSGLGYEVIDCTAADGAQAGWLRTATRAWGLSLGDRLCLAAAQRLAVAQLGSPSVSQTWRPECRAVHSIRRFWRGARALRRGRNLRSHALSRRRRRMHGWEAWLTFGFTLLALGLGVLSFKGRRGGGSDRSRREGGDASPSLGSRLHQRALIGSEKDGSGAEMIAKSPVRRGVVRQTGGATQRKATRFSSRGEGEDEGLDTEVTTETVDLWRRTSPPAGAGRAGGDNAPGLALWSSLLASMTEFAPSLFGLQPVEEAEEEEEDSPAHPGPLRPARAASATPTPLLDGPLPLD